MSTKYLYRNYHQRKSKKSDAAASLFFFVCVPRLERRLHEDTGGMEHRPFIDIEPRMMVWEDGANFWITGAREEETARDVL